MLALLGSLVTSALLGQPLAVPELVAGVDEVLPLVEPPLLPWLELLEPVELFEAWAVLPQATSKAARAKEHKDKNQ
jgi:hypothetical protein